MLYLNHNVLEIIACAMNSFATILQTSVMRTCSQIAECSLSYAKIMQTSVMRTCSQIAECSLSYAKIQIICDYMVCFSLHLYLILAPITLVLKSVLYLVDNQWAASGLKFCENLLQKGHF